MASEDGGGNSEEAFVGAAMSALSFTYMLRQIPPIHALPMARDRLKELVEAALRTRKKIATLESWRIVLVEALRETERLISRTN